MTVKGLMALCGWNMAALISVCDQLVLTALTTQDDFKYVHVKQ